MTIRNDRFANIRIKATGQVTEMAPHAARALVNSGMAEEVASSRPESTSVDPVAERAIAPAQAGATKKPFFGKKRA